MWYELKGTIKTISGTGAYSTAFKSGTRILQIKFAGAGTCTVPNGDGTDTSTITGLAGVWFDLQENHASRVLQGAGNQLQVAFSSGVTAWFIEYIDPAGAS